MLYKYVMDINEIKHQVIVSVQAMPDEPLYNEVCMKGMMESVMNGGAKVLRVAGERDVKIAKTLGATVIGITKPDGLPTNWKEIIYITPTTVESQLLIDAGADIVAFDGTSRPRPNDCSLKDIIDLIKSNGKLAMADISTFEEGLNCFELGADVLSTTLSGYTLESLSDNEAPDFELLEKLVKSTEIPVILEGRIWNPKDVTKAFELGAHSVVIGSAITRPQLITKRFIER